MCLIFYPFHTSVCLCRNINCSLPFAKLPVKFLCFLKKKFVRGSSLPILERPRLVVATN
jgi:hypothetical protein